MTIPVPTPALSRLAVRSFNDDKPFDQFVKEQVAGDEMNPQNPENLVATGFLRMGPWEQTGMSVFKETSSFGWTRDRLYGAGFLAHAMQCEKCHLISSTRSDP